MTQVFQCHCWKKSTPASVNRFLTAFFILSSFPNRSLARASLIWQNMWKPQSDKSGPNGGCSHFWLLQFKIVLFEVSADMGRVRCCIVMETVWFVFLGDVSWLLLNFFSINFTYLVVFLRRINTLFYCKKVHVTTGCLSDLDTTSNSRDLFKFCFVVIYQQYRNSIIFSSFLTNLCYILPIVKSQ